MTATLLVTVDTEEQFDWNSPPSRKATCVDHIRRLPRLHALFERLGARPTYVIDYPVATTPASAAVLGELAARGNCEIGCHVHPWVNPPYAEPVTRHNTFLCNLPRSLQEDKIGSLKDAILRELGIQTTTFKAGRYGIDFGIGQFLKKAGFTVDTSVLPYFDFSAEGGPDFRAHSNQPFYWNGREGDRNILEVPCTVGFNRRPFASCQRVHHVLAHPNLRALHPVGVLWRTGLLRKIVLSPEGHDLNDLLQLVKVMRRTSCPILNVTLHSSSIEPGHTSYVRTDRDLELFLERLGKLLAFIVGQLNAKCLTLAEYHASWTSALRE